MSINDNLAALGGGSANLGLSYLSRGRSFIQVDASVAGTAGGDNVYVEGYASNNPGQIVSDGDDLAFGLHDPAGYEVFHVANEGLYHLRAQMMVAAFGAFAGARFHSAWHCYDDAYAYVPDDDGSMGVDEFITSEMIPSIGGVRNRWLTFTKVVWMPPDSFFESGLLVKASDGSDLPTTLLKKVREILTIHRIA